MCSSGYSQYICATTVPLGLFIRDGHLCGLHRTFSCLHPLETFMVSSVKTSTSPQTEAFETIPVQGPLGPASEVYGIFINRNLLCTSAGQSR